MSDNLEDVIVSAVEDATSPEPAEVDETPSETPLEATPEAPESTTTEEVVPEAAPEEVASPAVKAADAVAKPEQDEFEKKFGIPKESSPGRENRIPYSRVTKIVAKAVKDAETQATASLTPRIKEFETKITDYEARLVQSGQLEKKVADFERVMIQEPAKFVSMLKTLPQYKDLLSQPAQPEAVNPETPISDDMPMPDQELENGSKVYSLEGLRDLNAWNRAQARKETLVEVEKLYGPIAHSYEENQKQAAAEKYKQEVLVPAVTAQIQDAYTWPLFKDNEDAIVKVLNENPKFNLERAYQTVVLPLLQTSKDNMRKQVIKDLQKAPVATSAPISGSRPVPQPAKSGPRDLEEIIREQAATLTR